jgi:hypothetical protein
MLKSKPQWLLTLHFNHPYSMTWMLSKLADFYARLDRRVLGRRFICHPGRTTGFIAFENLDLNAHAHCGIRLPRGWRRWPVEELQDWLLATWKELVPSGGLDLRRIDRTPEILAGYAAKQITHGARTERLFWVEDFWPAKLAYQKYDKIKAKKDREDREKAEKAEAEKAKKVKPRKL